MYKCTTCLSDIKVHNVQALTLFSLTAPGEALSISPLRCQRFLLTMAHTEVSIQPAIASSVSGNTAAHCRGPAQFVAAACTLLPKVSWYHSRLEIMSS